MSLCPGSAGSHSPIICWLSAKCIEEKPLPEVLALTPFLDSPLCGYNQSKPFQGPLTPSNRAYGDPIPPTGIPYFLAENPTFRRWESPLNFVEPNLATSPPGISSASMVSLRPHGGAPISEQYLWPDRSDSEDLRMGLSSGLGQPGPNSPTFFSSFLDSSLDRTTADYCLFSPRRTAKRPWRAGKTGGAECRAGLRLVSPQVSLRFVLSLGWGKESGWGNPEYLEVWF